MLGKRKSGSSVKLQAGGGQEGEEPDWICARLIEREVYAVE